MGIIVDVTIGDNFSGAVGYLTRGRSAAPTNKQATLLLATGVRTSSPEAMSADFELGRRANPDLRQAVWTTSLSFNPDDLEAGRLPPARQLEITRALCQKMGIVDTQLVVVLHGNTDKAHVHLVANRVNDRGQTISDSLCQWRAVVAARELVVEFGLTPSQGNRPELQHPERAVGQPARAEAFIRQGLGYTLQQATSRAELRAGLAAGGVEMRETERGLSFSFEGVAAKGSRLGPSFSAPAIDRQLAANRAAQQEAEAMRAQQREVEAARQREAEAVRVQQVEMEAARQREMEAVLARMRPLQLELEAARRQEAEAERRDDYGQVAALRYGIIPKAEQKLADDRQHVEALPGGPARLAVFDTEVTARAQAAEQARQEAAVADRIRAQALAQQQAQQQQAEQAQAAQQQQAQAAAAEVARARRLVESNQLELAQVIRQGAPPTRQRELQESLRAAEQRLDTCVLRAEASETGRILLRQQQETEQKRTRAGQVLGALADQGGSTSWEEFNKRAMQADYYFPPSQPGKVVELASMQLLEMPVVGGQRLDERLEGLFQREAHTRNQLAWLAEARAQTGNHYEAVRVRVAPAQVEQIRQVVGNMAQVAPEPGADGRLGINILYNARASSIQVSKVVDLVRATGGEVFEQPAAATYRERQTQLDINRLAGWPGLHKSQEQER